MRRWFLLFVIGVCCIAPPAGAQPTTGSTSETRQRDRVLTFMRKAIVEDYDRVGRRDERWNEDGRVVLEALARLMALDYRPIGDEYDLIAERARRIHDAGCSDPMVLFAVAKYGSFFNRKPEDTTPMYVEAARRINESAYHPAMKCLVNLPAAALRARERTDPRASRRDGRRLVEAAVEALPKAVADADVPDEVILQIFKLVGDASAIVERDRSITFEQVIALPEVAADPRKLMPLIRAQHLFDRAGDARRDSGLTPEQIEANVQQRLNEAAEAVEQAWKLGSADPDAAILMMHIEAARGRGEAVTSWYDRAVGADPDSYAARLTRMGYLEPRWPGGSLAKMLDFARECGKSERWELGIPMLLVEAHYRAWRLSDPADDPSTDYFASDPSIWRDIQSVYDPYLSRYPDSVFHRTRYAQLAAWCGQPQVADRQLRALGEDRFSLSWLRNPRNYQTLRAQVASQLTAQGKP